LFKERGEQAVMIDTDEASYLAAEKEGLQVFLSSALDQKVLEEAGLASIGTFLAMTTNGEVNLVLAQRAAEEFKPPRVLAIFPGSTTSGNNQTKINQPFIPDLPLKIWNDYLNDREVKLGETVLKESSLAFQIAHLQALIRSGELIPLLVEREGYLQVLNVNEEWLSGDRIIYLLHDPKPKLLKRLSGASQSNLTLEKHPLVEEVPMPSPVLEDVLEKAKVEEVIEV
jgi:Trk K+ transport system NAD-binding subunit